MSKDQPRDPKCPYPTQVLQGAHHTIPCRYTKVCLPNLRYLSRIRILRILRWTLTTQNTIPYRYTKVAMSTLRYPSRIRTLRILRLILRHNNIYLVDIPVLCLLRFYKRILSILIRQRYRKVQAIALFDIQGIVLISAKVLPQDPKYLYSPEVPQGTRDSLV